MQSIYLNQVGGATVTPTAIEAVWVYTAGDVYLNVRAGGMTFKETFIVERGKDGEIHDAAVCNAEAEANRLASDICKAMYEVLNRDAG